MTTALDPMHDATRSKRVIRDLTDAEARAALSLKWGSTDPDVIPAWVAEMDFAPAEPILDALYELTAGRLGYPRFEAGGDLGRAYAGFASRHSGQQVDRGHVLPFVDVTAGLRLALDVLSSPGQWRCRSRPTHRTSRSPQITGRERADLVLHPDTATPSLTWIGSITCFVPERAR